MKKDPAHREPVLCKSFHPCLSDIKKQHQDITGS